MLIDLGTDSYPSFADPDFADIFLAADVARAVGWALRNDDAKARGLVSATRMILRLPLSGVPAPDPTAVAADIPVVLQEVTAMLAADLLAKPRLFSDASANSKVKTAKAGSASVEFFSPTVGAPPLPLALWTELLNAGLVGAEEGGLPTPVVTGTSEECRPLGGRYPGYDWPLVQRDYD